MIGQVTSLAMMMLLTACATETPLPSAESVQAIVTSEQSALEDDAAVQKFAAIFCVNQSTFKKAVRNESLKFYGVIPTAAKFIVEIYAAPPGSTGFTIAIRNGAQDEVCIMLAGSELVPVTQATALQ